MSAPSRYEYNSPDYWADQDAAHAAAADEIYAELVADHRVIERGESILLARTMADDFRNVITDAQAGRLIAAWAATKGDATHEQKVLAASVILGVLDDVMREAIDERADAESDDRLRARQGQAAIDAYEDTRETA